MRNKLRFETDDWIIETEDAYLNLKANSDRGYEFDGSFYQATYTRKGEEVATCKTPEIYLDDLVAIQKLMEKLQDISSVNNVFEVEIHARVDDVDTWTVIGWGEAGDPCILRFEKNEDAR